PAATPHAAGRTRRVPPVNAGRARGKPVARRRAAGGPDPIVRSWSRTAVTHRDQYVGLAHVRYLRPGVGRLHIIRDPGDGPGMTVYGSTRDQSPWPEEPPPGHATGNAHDAGGAPPAGTVRGPATGNVHGPGSGDVRGP